MKEIHKFVLTGVLCGASCLFTYAQELYKNENAPVHERVADLLSRLCAFLMILPRSGHKMLP